jgi:hypothetical protein
MSLRLFGQKKKERPADDGAAAQVAEAHGSAAIEEPVEFQEVPGAPAAASPAETETVPAQVGAAKALRAARPTTGAPLDRVAARPSRPTAAKRGKTARPARKTTRKPARKTARRAAKTTKRSKRTGSKLTRKQLAQRKYAAQMRTVRGRAKKASGGKGRISKRAGATRLRRKLGLKAGKSGRKKR